jgi:hypothetical protein
MMLYLEVNEGGGEGVTVRKNSLSIFVHMKT